MRYSSLFMIESIPIWTPVVFFPASSSCPSRYLSLFCLLWVRSSISSISCLLNEKSVPFTAIS